MFSERVPLVRGMQVLRQSLYTKHTQQVQRTSTASVQAKISRAIHLARLRSYMLHLIQDPNDGAYLLLETICANIACVYLAPDTENCWLPLSALPTTVRTRDNSPENFRSWKAGTNFNFVYAHRTKEGILNFINNHPELLI